MKFNYENVGDILYGVEMFRFRYKGKSTAEITLLNLLDDGQYAYEVEIESYISTEFQNFTSANFQLFESLEIESKSIFNSKEEALQHAIKATSKIVSKTEKV